MTTGDRFDRDRSDIGFLVEFELLADGEHADAYLPHLRELFFVGGASVDSSGSDSPLAA